MSTAQPSDGRPLARGLRLWPATTANIINMVGIGPFITLPLIIGVMGGPQAMLGWIAGALLSLCDGLVWAELGAAMPGSGASYHYLLEAYGRNGLGRLMRFLFLWQVILLAPLSAASGAVGFAQYAAWLIPGIDPVWTKPVAAGACLLVTVLLYRDIREVGRLTVILGVVVVAVLGWIVIAGLLHFHAELAFNFPAGAWRMTPQFFAGLASATLLAVYGYGGYSNVCYIGGEVEDPARNIPRAIVLSIVIVGVLYLGMSLAVLGVIPYREAMHSSSIIAEFAQRLYGLATARFITLLILIAAFASVFAILLGYSRVPYTAAVDGEFFRIFGRLHPTKRFPSFAVVALGLAAAVCCLIPLQDLIGIIIVTQIVIQFVPQCLGVILIRRYRKHIHQPFRMWLYPLPAILALFGWIAILFTSNSRYALLAGCVLVMGVLAYFVRARGRREWPFMRASA